MGATREKLFEAEYFLAQMEEKRADRAAFRYSFSAFLSAARSVTFFAQKEFKRACGFEEWYAKKQEAMGADPAMRFFLEARNITLKQEYVPTRAQINATVTSTVSITAAAWATVIRTDGTREERDLNTSDLPQTPAPTKSETAIEWAWYFKSLPGNLSEKDVVTLSAEHVAKLRAFVEECEATFSS